MKIKIYGTSCTHHNSIYNIILVIFKGFDGFCSRHVRLGHDQFDILGFYSCFVALKWVQWNDKYILFKHCGIITILRYWKYLFVIILLLKPGRHTREGYVIVRQSVITSLWCTRSLLIFSTVPSRIVPKLPSFSKQNCMDHAHETCHYSFLSCITACRIPTKFCMFQPIRFQLEGKCSARYYTTVLSTKVHDVLLTTKYVVLRWNSICYSSLRVQEFHDGQSLGGAEDHLSRFPDLFQFDDKQYLKSPEN